MGDNRDLPHETSAEEISFDELNKSLSVICLDDTENEQSPGTASKNELQYCSSTPIRATRSRHHCYNENDTNDYGNCQPLANDDSVITIDASMSNLSILEPEETKLDFKDAPFLKGKGAGDALSASTKNVCTKPNDSLQMSVVISGQPKLLDNVDCVTTTDSKLGNLLNLENKTKQNVLNSMSPTTANLYKKLDSLYQLLKFQPNEKKETQTSKERKHTLRKKFLQNKKQKKLAAVRAKESEDKENKVPDVRPKQAVNVTKLTTQTTVCQNVDKKAFQIIQNWIGEPPPEKKESEKKIQEFVSDDQKENLDINDPEWDNVKCLKTDEERYKAVKACWRSKRAPHPQKDLTFHSFRHKRVQAHGRKLLRANKRTATDTTGCGLVTKLRKVEEAPCTLFLDQKITDAKKQFDNQRNNNVWSFNQQKEDIDKDYAERNEDLMNKYYREVKRIQRMHVNEYSRHWFFKSLDSWLNKQKKWLHEDLLRKKERVEKEKDKTLGYLRKNYSFTVKQLEEARNEVLKFNQFYCGLNKLDPTILRGEFLEEIKALEDICLAYERHYGLAH